MVVIYTVTFDLLISGASLPDGTNKQSQESLRGGHFPRNDRPKLLGLTGKGVHVVLRELVRII